jgi:hypothetical protein
VAGKLLLAGSVVLQCQAQAPCKANSVLTHSQDEHPCILQHFDTFLERVNGKRVAVFLDYDGRVLHWLLLSCCMHIKLSELMPAVCCCLQGPSHLSSTTQTMLFCHHR